MSKPSRTKNLEASIKPVLSVINLARSALEKEINDLKFAIEADGTVTAYSGGTKLFNCELDELLQSAEKFPEKFKEEWAKLDKDTKEFMKIFEYNFSTVEPMFVDQKLDWMDEWEIKESPDLDALVRMGLLSEDEERYLSTKLSHSPIFLKLMD